MSYSTYYNGVIFTNHALSRMHERKLPQSWAADTLLKADTSHPGKQHGTTEFSRRFGKYLVTAIANKNEKGEWVIVSCWIDPPYYGTADYNKKQKYVSYVKSYKKASILGKFWIELKRAVGL